MPFCQELGEKEDETSSSEKATALSHAEESSGL